MAGLGRCGAGGKEKGGEDNPESVSCCSMLSHFHESKSSE
jgi:hypothetical protein